LAGQPRALSRILPERLTVKKKPAKKSVWKNVTGKIGGAAASMGRGIGTASQRVRERFKPAARRVSSTAAKVSEVVDPASLGGAVVGLTAGQILGGIVGGTAGLALGGPVGAVAGAQLGGLTGGTVGLKIGYDVTYDTIHKKKKRKKATVKENAVGLARTLVKRSGDSVGSGVGALGGAVVGTAIAGPVGGAFGAFVGESLAGDFVENRSLETFDQQVNSARKRDPKKRPPKKQKQAGGRIAKTGKWAGGAMRDAVLEGGAEAAFAMVGALAAGPLGARIAGRAGLVAAKRVDWNEALSDTPAPKKRRKAKAPSRASAPEGKLDLAPSEPGSFPRPGPPKRQPRR